MIAARTAIGPADVSTSNLRRIARSTIARFRALLDRLVTSSSQNVTGPNRELRPEFFKYPLF